MPKSPLTLDPVSALLAWYDKYARVLPWRFRPGQTANPYHVWLSEIMLQQTTVVTVGPYFNKFLKRWPTVIDLAAAPLDDVLANWAGLGYYARARNLHKCAVAVAANGGVFPDSEAGLMDLPGIGPYTAAAIGAIAYDLPLMPVDGNIERVTARYLAISKPLPGVKGELRDKAQKFKTNDRPGDMAQALMDLGATICTPRNPTCEACPISKGCKALAKGIAADLPKRSPKKPRPVRYATMFWLTRPDGRVLLQKRPEKGLLGSMLGLASTEWLEEPVGNVETHAPAKSKWTAVDGTVGHTFTHFHLEVSVLTAKTSRKEKTGEIWLLPEDLGDHAVPTLFRKVGKFVAS
ncbi:MAG: A/G-specific adenine glycosylase [Alphaproteobacteria bacterium]|jgi:A/G-specific adenine glycosylase|nr:A/G-specific adenine glycosylase [Alphaproteobacteria bacterium]MBT4964784.1 A/G-specific adenine glycosylase [Alphaproteobacteria bacterium]MBT5162110.1 A/G-specific adenine glycosylase [Alphaproteobacteria bacterium]MBT5919394.1 A/G-specific adenine glycosylase [Alphaproteobacteria bacterium]MBT6386272.1 A/G-specific adenine glycosylase [Alphaproteobacteria bacterium]